jgi:hypothetical protein
MLLLSSGAFEHGVIEQLTAQNSGPSSLRDKHQQLGMERPAGHQNPESGIGAISSGLPLVETAGSSFTTHCSTGSISTCETRIGASPGMLPSLFLRIRHRHSLTLG